MNRLFPALIFISLFQVGTVKGRSPEVTCTGCPEGVVGCINSGGAVIACGQPGCYGCLKNGSYSGKNPVAPGYVPFKKKK